jgi:MFS family permease
MSAPPSAAPIVSRSYAWIVFALTFGLLLSDYMSRQVLNAVFPILKAEWSLSDTQLGSLGGIVALLVGLLAFPLSMLADRWGRVKSIILMAVLWSLATLACALAQSYGHMFAARFLVGVGEAAYGSVGLAVILSVFPAHMRSTLTGAFMSGGAVGSVLGMGLGGVVAVNFGWRWSFASMALFGMVLALLYSVVVTERRLAQENPAGRGASERESPGFRALLSSLFSFPSIRCAYVGSGLQLFTIASLQVWLPSYVNRYYDMPPDKSGLVAAIFVLIGAVGMVLCGIVTDRLSRDDPARKWIIATTYSLSSCLLLSIAFALPTGQAQLVMIGCGMLFVAGTAGPAGAMVANLTHPSIHATALATLTLANNLLGLAPGPFLTGVIADRVGLLGAMQFAPILAVGAATAFFIGRRHYERDLQRLSARTP